LIVIGILAAVFALGATAGAPTPFELIFDGQHIPLATSPNGFGHAGSFTATGLLCPAGKATDLRVTVTQQVASTRVYTCDDGSGQFTVHVIDIPNEHIVGGTGTWQIVGGTGSYAKLRGTGTWKTTATHGDESNISKLTYTTKTQGTAFIDDVPPAAGFVRTTAKKLTAPGLYRITVVFFARDDAHSGSSYRLRVKAGSHLLGSLAGQTAFNAVSVSVRVKPGSTRVLRVELTATDTVGNRLTIARSVTVPR
jgi:hypothetical protein